MTAVYVLRHPQTTWNVAQRYQGRLESPVSPEGRRQARLVAQAFARHDLDLIVSSPLRRARYLADELSRVTGAAVETDNRLTEIGVGAWEGLLLQEIRDKYPDLHDEWYQHPATATAPQGETIHDVQRRAVSALQDVYAAYPAANVGVITHSVVIQTLVAASLSMDLDHVHRLHLSNAGITIFCGAEAPGSLLSLNSTEALYGTPVGSAGAQECATWKPRRMAS